MNDVMKVPLRHRKAQFQNIDGDCSTSSEGSPTKHQNPQAGPPAGGPQGASKAVHQHKHFHWIMCGSFLLTINAGYINTVTLHTSHAMPTSHVTGIVTRAAGLLATQHEWLFLEFVTTYFCFVCGACISGMIINYETFYLGRNYGRALCLIAAVQGIALLIENAFDDSIAFIFACALACGLQNGLTSKYSGNAVRTTHLSGASTDLGIAFGHILKGRKGEWWKIQMHGIAIVGFFIGGFTGHFAYQKYEHSALLVNVFLTIFCAVAHTGYVAYHENLPVIKVLESTADIRIHKHSRRASDDSGVKSRRNCNYVDSTVHDGSEWDRRLMQKDVDSSVHSSQSAPVVPTDRLPLRLAPPAAAAPVVTYYEDDDPALDADGRAEGSSFRSDPGAATKGVTSDDTVPFNRVPSYVDPQKAFIRDDDREATPEEEPYPAYDSDDVAGAEGDGSEEDEEEEDADDNESDIEMAIVQQRPHYLQSYDSSTSTDGDVNRRPRGMSL